jgi:hypothetical protein
MLKSKTVCILITCALTCCTFAIAQQPEKLLTNNHVLSLANERRTRKSNHRCRSVKMLHGIYHKEH